MASPDLSRPGLVIDLARRVDPLRLKACFGMVKPLTAIERVDPSTPAKTYVLYEVADPRRDVLGVGCNL